MIYTILQEEHSGKLVMSVHDFISKNPNFMFLGGPYSDGRYHYQALVKKEEKQQLNG